jgi:hypothetical protein
MRDPLVAAWLSTQQFDLADGSVVDWKDLAGAKATVIVTLDPGCPFSQAYAPLLDSLTDVFAPQGIGFAGLYPAGFISGDSAVTFAHRTGLDFPQLMDDDCLFSNALHARVTPEAFVIGPQGAMLYRGALDDSAVRAGRKKLRATRNYLADALTAITKSGVPAEAEVTAVGCIVECEGDAPEE